MVYFKRKPVKIEPPSPSIDDNTEVWVLEETEEVFVEYEKYLNRLDFLSQRLFTCEATGHQGYTYFDAHNSELEASKEINSIFPEALRSRVLALVQFKEIARMDDLVNKVYDYFRENYAVGDRVYVDHENGRKHGTVSRKEPTSGLPHFNGNDSDDEQRAFTYTIIVDETGEVLTKYKASELSRDRTVYSKLVMKHFLRGTVSRESWNGAPWMVKEHLAKRYGIPTKIPEAKSREAIMAEKKARNAARANANHQANAQGMPHGQNGTMSANGHSVYPPPHQGHPSFVNYAAHAGAPYRPNSGQPMMQMPPPMNGGPPRQHQSSPYGQPGQSGQFGPPHAYQPMPPPHMMVPRNLPPYATQLANQMPPPGPGGPSGHPGPPGPPGSGGPSLPISLPFQNNFMQYQTLGPPPSASQQQAHHAPPPRPFEIVKYPIEDLKIKQPRLNPRPSLKFLSDDVPDGIETVEDDKKTGILMKSVGPLLCCWDTLNVHDTIYALDSFTLDDFIGAMRFSSKDTECELLAEVHCCILKQIVNESGKLQVPLPKIAESDESEHGESEKSTSPEPEPEPPVRTTRSSLRKSEANAIIVKPRTPTPEPPRQIHKAADFLAEYSWIEECKARKFRAGGWQAMLVGLLYRLSFSPSHKAICDEILAELVPSDEEFSAENIASRYVGLDVNLRISALENIMRLTVATDIFRDALMASSAEMTRLRKEKIEFQRKRKELTDELFKLDIERKIQLPLNSPADPPDASMTGTDEAKPEEEQHAREDGEQDDQPPTAANRKLRNTGKNKRKRETEEEKKEKAEKAKKAKLAAAKSKQQKEWEKLLAAIEKKKEEVKECEANINELDDDLRETLVHRSKVLGKDRFLNKYYWFEHNGMPYGGVPNSSTSKYGYANGRLWVQGPDEHEIQPNMEEPALSQDLHDLGYTVPQRKEKEEGSTHLSHSTQWGYYDDPSAIDDLMKWLDERGVREKALRKELMASRDKITEYMLKMKAHLFEEDKGNKSDDEEEEIATRISTRKKAKVDKDDIPKDRCLLWTNSIMRAELGYNHLEEYEEPEPEPEPPKKNTKKGTAKVTKAKGRR